MPTCIMLLEQYSKAVKEIFATEINTIHDFLAFLRRYNAVYEYIEKTAPDIKTSSSKYEVVYRFIELYYDISSDIDMFSLRTNIQNTIKLKSLELEKHIIETLLKGEKCIISSKDWSIIHIDSLTKKIRDICDSNSLFVEEHHGTFDITILVD